MSFWRVAQLFLVFTITLCLSAPVYWYDMGKQNLYTFDDPGLVKFASVVGDSDSLPVDSRVFNHIMDFSSMNKRGTLQKLRPYFGKNAWTKMFASQKAQSQ